MKKPPEVRTYVPPALMAALKRAAKRRLCTVSVYTRQTLQAHLTEEGLLPAADETAQTRERVSV